MAITQLAEGVWPTRLLINSIASFTKEFENWRAKGTRDAVSKQHGYVMPSGCYSEKAAINPSIQLCILTPFLTAHDCTSCSTVLPPWRIIRMHMRWLDWHPAKTQILAAWWITHAMVKRNGRDHVTQWSTPTREYKWTLISNL